MGTSNADQHRGRAFSPGVIRPRGWLRCQLEIQAAGLSGHLDEFWPDVRDSGWIGGTAEGWERAPYWLDGLVPLAFLLEDERLIAKVDRWVRFIIDHQGEDGWLGPQQQEQQGFHSERDPWPLFIILKVLTQYAMAREEDAPGARPFDTIARALRAINSHLDKRPLYDWGKYRWADLLVTILWLRTRTQEPVLDELAERIHLQGYNWESHFERFPFRGRSDRWTFDRHVVNNAMGIKAPALWELYATGRISAGTVLDVIAVLDSHHGQATGMFSGDETLAGRMPSQGTELCAVVEYLYSLEEILPNQADIRICDRLERIAFNALPAPFSPDMWAHQYDQQVNQAQCVITEDPIYTSNRGDANLYGLEPHFGCCTANMHQGFPKFASSLWHRSADGAIRAVSYAPCEMALTARELGGAEKADDGSLTITVSGEYPLAETVEITVTGEGSITRQTRAIVLPIPSWAEGATLSRDSAEARPVAAGSHVRLEGVWEHEHRLVLHLPMRVRIEHRYNGAVAVTCGPLLLGFQPEETWEHERGEHPHSDWRVTPETPWNVAIAIGEGDTGGLWAERYVASGTGITNLLDDGPLAGLYKPENRARRESPVRIPVRYRQIRSWALEHGAAAAPPASPVEPAALGKTEHNGYLMPYGASGLRIAEIPWYSSSR